MINNWDILQEKNFVGSVRADPLAGVENDVFFPVLKDCSVPLKGEVVVLRPFFHFVLEPFFPLVS